MIARTNTWQYGVAERGLSVPAGSGVQGGKIGAKIILLAYMLPLVMILAIPYFVNIKMEEKGFEVNAVRTRVMQISKENEALRLEVGQLKAPGRVQAIAESKLGMFIPIEVLYSSTGTKQVAAGGSSSANSIKD